MKLKNYYKKSVKITDKEGIEYIGDVTGYVNPRNNPKCKERIYLQEPTIEFDEDNIEKIELLSQDRSLIPVDDLCELLESTPEIIETELDKIDAEVFRAYTRIDASRIAINMNRMDFFDWTCDNCGNYLNFQQNFPIEGGECKCVQCGYMNMIRKEDIVN